MSKKLLALYGLKWNPFAPDVPVEALHATNRIESFCWRVEQLAGEGGFALITGAPGIGKSVTLRILADRLTQNRDVAVGVLSRPQAALSDFYRSCRYRHERYYSDSRIIPHPALGMLIFGEFRRSHVGITKGFAGMR